MRVFRLTATGLVLAALAVAAVTSPERIVPSPPEPAEAAIAGNDDTVIASPRLARANAAPTDRHDAYVTNPPPSPAAAASVQQPFSRPDAGGDHGYRFVRIRYQGTRGAGWRGNTWAYDWPTADRNLQEAIDRTTAVHVEGAPIVLTLDDEAIFEYPILYLTEPGYWYVTDEEVANVQEYFRRGGFMIIDDFHDYPGRVPDEWNNFYNNIKQIFPDREPVLLDREDPFWSIFYEIDPTQTPSTKPRLTKDDVKYYGIFDDDGRMIVVVSYNQDLGDGWEWPDRNANDESIMSFKIGVNVVMWALSH